MEENVSAQNVTASKPKVGGSVFYAPIGTELPADAKSELNEVFESVGYISDDGVKTGGENGSTVKAWGGDIVLITGGGDQFSMTFIETLRDSVLKLVHGKDNVKGTLETGITVEVGDKDIENYSFVIDMVQKGGVLKRLVFPKACITEVGEVTYNDDDAVGYEVTLTAQKMKITNIIKNYSQKKELHNLWKKKKIIKLLLQVSDTKSMMKLWMIGKH